LSIGAKISWLVGSENSLIGRRLLQGREGKLYLLGSPWRIRYDILVGCSFGPSSWLCSLRWGKTHTWHQKSCIWWVDGWTGGENETMRKLRCFYDHLQRCFLHSINFESM